MTLKTVLGHARRAMVRVPYPVRPERLGASRRLLVLREKPVDEAIAFLYLPPAQALGDVSHRVPDSPGRLAAVNAGEKLPVGVFLAESGI